MLTDKCNQHQLLSVIDSRPRGAHDCDNVSNISVAVEYEELHHHHLTVLQTIGAQGKNWNRNVK